MHFIKQDRCEFSKITSIVILYSSLRSKQSFQNFCYTFVLTASNFRQTFSKVIMVVILYILKSQVHIHVME